MCCSTSPSGAWASGSGDTSPVSESAHSASAAYQPCVQQARQWRNAGRYVVVYAGALGRPNYVDSLVQAIAHLRDLGDDKVCAIIVGRGELQEELRAKAKVE